MFEHEHPSLWQEMQTANTEWAAAYEGGPDWSEAGDGGEYTGTGYLPPPPPTSWNPPQPPTTSYAPPSHPYLTSILFLHYRPDQQRALCRKRKHRPPYASTPCRDRYRPPQRTIGDVYSERGLPPRLTSVDKTRY